MRWVSILVGLCVAVAETPDIFPIFKRFSVLLAELSKLADQELGPSVAGRQGGINYQVHLGLVQNLKLRLGNKSPRLAKGPTTLCATGHTKPLVCQRARRWVETPGCTGRAFGSRRRMGRAVRVKEMKVLVA